MADILVSNEDLTVFGGPVEISLDLDIGPPKTVRSSFDTRISAMINLQELGLV